RPARGAAPCAVPAELRLRVPDRRPRSRGRRQLLRAVRRAPDLRRDPARRARKGRGEIERALRAVAAAPVTAANAGIRPGPLRIDSPRPFDTLRLDSRIRGKDRSIDFARPSTG